MENQDKFAIHAAARDGKATVVESLLNANPKLAKLKDDDGRLPIHWAASYNHHEIVNLLVQQKGFDVDAKDDMGWTPLMIAASVKDSDRVVDLLLARDADVNETTPNSSLDSPPLHSLQVQPRPRPQAPRRAQTSRFRPRPRQARPVPPPPRRRRRFGPLDQPVSQAQKSPERQRFSWTNGVASCYCRGAW
ncbi:putative ankyrin-repeat protein [Podospora pseudopauciseta]|uniref:Ankyrin-repeat protein n=1 Tax=Podospora pseudopauciseta TaxID=2093780 RepID=A0ABR0I1I5_9PEZI|nr:putative ankyrin-repeat protein [Podospora pseudopauciseta]